ncbi:unnamed protein product [Cuscuta campestris]|uniref:Retroviral polymerase SH3-like domain-containing protein n=1 Tax=Cuscuta campestris TaxID=132261 RepID=A0A484N6L3_9ASTE|nr:unnamed protein product [Cuscuta campestris]
MELELVFPPSWTADRERMGEEMDERSKLDVKTRQCIFVGYGHDEFGYRLYDPVEKKLVRSRDVIFIEDQNIEDIQKMDKLESQNYDDLVDLNPTPVAQTPNATNGDQNDDNSNVPHDSADGNVEEESNEILSRGKSGDLGHYTFICVLAFPTKSSSVNHEQSLRRISVGNPQDRHAQILQWGSYRPPLIGVQTSFWSPFQCFSLTFCGRPLLCHHVLNLFKILDNFHSRRKWPRPIFNIFHWLTFTYSHINDNILFLPGRKQSKA